MGRGEARLENREWLLVKTESPGLGIEVDEAEAAKHPVQAGNICYFGCACGRRRHSGLVKVDMVESWDGSL